MRVLVVGAGPAGLYSAYLLKRKRPDWEIVVVDQNPPDSTFGFGVVFSDRALEFLRADDEETFELVTPFMEKWANLTLSHAGERIVIDGIGFASIGRLKLLALLQRQLASVGVTPQTERVVAARSELEGFDLVIGADGVNSIVRRTFADLFGTEVVHLGNKFAWYGTARTFDTLTQTFVRAPAGTFNAHPYRYSATMSTFLVDADPETWARAGFATMDESSTRAYVEGVFADVLGGERLFANNTVWRTFPKVVNQRWSARVSSNAHAVLLGDALHTAHYSIGSGTRLALEDAAALARALDEHPSAIGDALEAFEGGRRPAADKLVAAANISADWYEHYPEHMRLAPWDLAWSYIQRSGRVDANKLRKIAPAFVAGYEAAKGGIATGAREGRSQ